MEIKQHENFTKKGGMIAEGIVKEIIRKGIPTRISTTWKDYGQGLSWDAILVYSHSLKSDYQLLTPKEFEKINDGSITDEEIENIIDKC
jgi:hypothetical protein